jgi:hypothetical protein
MIKKIIISIFSYFRTIYVFESKKNLKLLAYKNFKLKKYDELKLIKDKEIINYIYQNKKNRRFNNKQSLFVLFFKKNIVSVGWMYQGKVWRISEINKKINIKNKILLYDFLVFKKFRNRGFYSVILNLIKNLKTSKLFLIYCLKSNEASKKGILNSKFKIIKKIGKNVSL